MLHSFYCSNFLSFHEDIELNFELSKSDTHDNASSADVGKRVSKIVMVSGHNASGKTNLLKALSFLNWFVFSSFRALDPGQKIPLQPHFFAPDESSIIEVTFGAGDNLYRYHLELNQARVLQEELHRRSETTGHFNFLFKKVWVDADAQYKISKAPEFGFNQRGIRIRENASFIAQALHHGVEEAQHLKDVIHVFSNVNFSSNASHINRDYSLTGLPSAINSASEFFYKDACYFGMAKRLLLSLDVGVDDLEIEEQNSTKGNGEKIYIPYGIHRKGDQEVRQHLLAESTGTQMVYVLSRDLMRALDNGGVAVIDELDSDLHPDVVEFIVDLFIDPEWNPHNAQLIFTSHNHEVMNKLNKKQIVLVEKDNHDSDAWVLSDMEDVRSDHNFFKKYRSGAYGAVANF